jgi:hypothetical protein
MSRLLVSDRLVYEFLIARLMELILVEMLRRETPKEDDRSAGLIAGLLDPAIAGALRPFMARLHAIGAWQSWRVYEVCRGRGLRHVSRKYWA